VTLKWFFRVVILARKAASGAWDKEIKCNDRLGYDLPTQQIGLAAQPDCPGDQANRHGTQHKQPDELLPHEQTQRRVVQVQIVPDSIVAFNFFVLRTGSGFSR
jgi:hypothetical protein